MDISSCYFCRQYKSSCVTGGMRLICKLPFVFSLYEHPTVRVGRGYCLFRSSSTAGRVLRIIVIPVILNGLLSQCLPFFIDLPAKLSQIHLCCFGNLLLLELLLVSARLILVLDKKLSKLFIAPKVRQELHETAFVALCHKRATRTAVPS